MLFKRSILAVREASIKQPVPPPLPEKPLVISWASERIGEKLPDAGWTILTYYSTTFRRRRTTPQQIPVVARLQLASEFVPGKRVYFLTHSKCRFRSGYDFLLP